jgi:hypothetical protein
MDSFFSPVAFCLSGNKAAFGIPDILCMVDYDFRH